MSNNLNFAKEIDNLLEAAYWERRLGRIRSSDLFEETAKALSQIRFKTKE